MPHVLKMKDGKLLIPFGIATAVLPLFAGNDQYEVMSCEVTENRLYLKVVNHRLEMEVRNGDIVQAGVMISNSEVGLGAVSIQPLVYRLVCTNGMVVNDMGERRHHVGRQAKAVEDSFALYSDETMEAEDKDLLIPLKDGDIDAANAASLTGKLLQMSNGAVYDENGKARIIHDHKLEALEDLIEAANGQPVLVAYWFKHDRQRIMEHLAKQKIPVRDIKSSTDIRDWNAGDIPVALIHPASAGHGLNIQQGGHILIWFGLTWSLELYQQTNARLWRQGQTNVVTIHHIITKDTVDEDVMAALEQKDMTQEKLISAVKAQLGR